MTDPKSTPVLPGLDVEADLRLAEPLRDLLRLLEALRLVQRAAGVDLLELRDPGGRRRLRELARQRKFRAYPRATSTTSPRRPSFSTSSRRTTFI